MKLLLLKLHFYVPPYNVLALSKVVYNFNPWAEEFTQSSREPSPSGDETCSLTSPYRVLLVYAHYSVTNFTPWPGKADLWKHCPMFPPLGIEPRPST